METVKMVLDDLYKVIASFLFNPGNIGLLCFVILLGYSGFMRSKNMVWAYSSRSDEMRERYSVSKKLASFSGILVIILCSFNIRDNVGGDIGDIYLFSLIVSSIIAGLIFLTGFALGLKS